MLANMLIYRFKIKFEDQDEFLREIEVRADQTFEVFYRAIVENLKLDQGTLSSFFICDHKFRKKSEISLFDMNPEMPEEGGKHVPVMGDSHLNEYIDDPHQKLLLVYDYLNYWTFYIELIRILPANPSHTYPRFSKTEGETPRELTTIPGVMPDLEENFEFSFEEDGYDPEDLESLEGEEDFLPEEENNPEGLDEEKP